MANLHITSSTAVYTQKGNHEFCILYAKWIVSDSTILHNTAGKAIIIVWNLYAWLGQIRATLDMFEGNLHPI